jgi:hypothetical protein
MPFKERRRYLESDYGFTCSCSLCNAPEPLRERSDRHRIEMAALRDNIDMARRRRRWTDAAQYASQAVEKLSEAEVLAPGVLDCSLTPLHLDHYQELAEFHLRMGDVDMARGFGEKALGMASYLRGADSHDARELRRFLEALE